MTGKISHINRSHGFGFVVSENNPDGIYFHCSALAKHKFDRLEVGDDVTYDVGEYGGRPVCVNMICTTQHARKIMHGFIWCVKSDYAFIKIDDIPKPIFCPATELNRPVNVADTHASVTIGTLTTDGDGRQVCRSVWLHEAKRETITATGKIAKYVNTYGFVQIDSKPFVGREAYFNTTQLPQDYKPEEDKDRPVTCEIVQSTKGLRAYTIRFTDVEATA